MADNRSLLQEADEAEGESFRSLVEKIQEPFYQRRESFGFDSQLEGWLFTQSHRSRKWKRSWFVLNGMTLFHFKKQMPKGSTGRPNGVIPASFATLDPMSTTEKEFVTAGFAKQGEDYVSSKMLRIYSPGRIHQLCATSDEELEKFYQMITREIKEVMEEAEYESRRKAAEMLAPMLRTHYESEMVRAEKIFELWKQHEFHLDEFQTAAKKGYLEMLGDGYEESWKHYTFALDANRKFLYYKPCNDEQEDKPATTTSDHAEVPVRVISLKYATVHPVAEAGQEETVKFELRTPLVSYTLRAKHGTAQTEWINSIQQVIDSGKRLSKKKSADTGGLLLEDIGGDEGDGQKYHWQRPYIVVGDAGGGVKKKIYKLTREVTVIGRETTNDVVLEDFGVSRQHAKIHKKKNNVLMFLDLGSKAGSKVNGVSVAKHVLQPGDKIRLGKAVLVVEDDTGTPASRWPGATKTGFMMKRSPAFLHSKQKRFIVLRNYALFYFKKPEDVIPVGVIDLRYFNVKEKDDGVTLDLVGDARTFTMVLKNEEEKRSWLEAIKAAREANKMAEAAMKHDEAAEGAAAPATAAGSGPAAAQ